MENSGCFPWRKPAATESRYPTYGAYWVFKCFHNPSNSDMDYGMFNVHTNVNACDCTRGCTDTRKRVCTESWHWEKNPLPHRGIEPASAACRSDVPATELHPQKTKRLAKATAGVWLPSSLPASDSLCYIRLHNKDLTSVSAYAVAISPFVTFFYRFTEPDLGKVQKRGS